MLRRVLVLFAAFLMPLPAVAGVVVAGPPPPYVIAFNGQSGDVSVNSFTNAFCYTCTMPGITMTSPATLDGSNVATSATVTSALSPYLTSSTAASTYSTPASVATAIAAITPYTAGSGIAINAGTRVVTATPTAFAVSYPNSRTFSLATAYQCTDPTKPCAVTINLTSTANFSLSGGTTNSASVVIGSTSAVASGTGTILGKYSNSVTGTIAVGLNLNSAAASPITVVIPTGGFLAVLQTSGTVTISSGFDQAMG